MRTNPNIDALEQNLRKLRIEYERYFNGALDLPPAELQNQIERRIRDLRSSVKSSIDRFRMGTIEASYNTYLEMFNRRIRDFEEGRVKARRSRESGPPRFDPIAGVTVGSEIDSGAAAALFQGLYADSAKAGRVDLDSFRSYIDKQASMIRQKTGCQEVQFRLANEGGKMKLKAKPIRTEAAGSQSSS